VRNGKWLDGGGCGGACTSSGKSGHASKGPPTAVREYKTFNNSIKCVILEASNFSLFSGTLNMSNYNIYMYAKRRERERERERERKDSYLLELDNRVGLMSDQLPFIRQQSIEIYPQA
jgi:hypothetical protein